MIADGPGESLKSRRQKIHPNRWDLYLQKLLSDSTEIFFILKIILLARGGGLEKLQKWHFFRK